eukprot:symbB.v1.2.002728.t1/scaffold146.1/size298692/9
MIQRPRLFIAEVQVPVLERLGLETTDKEVSLNASVGAGCSSESLKLLSVGDVFLAEVHADEAAEERGEVNSKQHFPSWEFEIRQLQEWLRILEYRFCLNPSVFQDDTEDLENQEGSTDVSESEDGDREETSMQVYKGNHVVGGFVLRRHRLMGTFLRPLDKVQLNESPVRTEPAERDLPEESRIWPRDILERFVVTGERPCWRSDPGEESLALHGPMSQMEVEDALRTAALWLSHADALLVLAGEGMAEKTSPWPGRENGKTLEQICMRSTFLEEPQLAWDCWLHYCRRYRDSTPHSGFHSSLLQHPALGSFVVSSCWDGQWAVAGWASHLWELNGVALELRCATACTTATWAMPEELLESLRELPRCPRCGAPALPAVKLLDEAFKNLNRFWRHINEAMSMQERLDTQLYVEQEIRFQSFLKRCSEMRSELVILDLGTWPCSELRLRAERLAGHPPANCRVRLLRVQRSFPALPQRLRGTACAVPLPCVEALQRDSDGCGAEVVAPRDAPLSFVFRKACQALSLNNAMIKAGSVLRELRVQDLSASDIVPAELFFKDRDDFPPVVRIWVAGVSFPSRNERLEQRLSSIWSLIKDLPIQPFCGVFDAPHPNPVQDLVEAFETEEYQRKCFTVWAIMALRRGTVEVFVLWSHLCCRTRRRKCEQALEDRQKESEMAFRRAERQQKEVQQQWERREQFLLQQSSELQELENLMDNWRQKQEYSQLVLDELKMMASSLTERALLREDATCLQSVFQCWLLYAQHSHALEGDITEIVGAKVPRPSEVSDPSSNVGDLLIAAASVVEERVLWFWEPLLSAILLFWQTFTQSAALEKQLEKQRQQKHDAEYQQSLQRFRQLQDLEGRQLLSRQHARSAVKRLISDGNFYEAVICAWKVQAGCHRQDPHFQLPSLKIQQGETLLAQIGASAIALNMRRAMLLLDTECDGPVKPIDIPETPSTSVPTAVSSPLSSPCFEDTSSRKQCLEDAQWLNGNGRKGLAVLDIGGVSTPDLPVFPSLLVPPPVVALMPQCRLQLSPCSWQISLPPPGRRPRPLAMVRANLAVIAEACVLRRGHSSCARSASQVVAALAPDERSLLRASGRLCLTSSGTSAWRMAWQTLAATCLRGGLLQKALTGDFGIKTSSMVSASMADWLVTKEAPPLLLAGSGVDVADALLCDVLSLSKARVSVSGRWHMEFAPCKSHLTMSALVQRSLDNQGLFFPSVKVATVELSSAGAVDYLKQTVLSKKVFKVRNMLDFSPAGLTSCTWLSVEKVPSAKLALQSLQSVSTVALPRALGAKKSRPVIFDMSLPPKEEVSQDIANLFGASSSSSLVSLLWHLKRCATWKDVIIPGREKVTNAPRLTPFSGPHFQVLQCAPRMDVLTKWHNNDLAQRWAKYLAKERRAGREVWRLVVPFSMRASLAMALRVEPLRNINDVTVDAVDTKECCMERVYDMPLPHNAPVLYGGQFQVIPTTEAIVSAKQCVEKYQSNEEDPAVSAVDLP